jgi:hypothetical protein
VTTLTESKKAVRKNLHQYQIHYLCRTVSTQDSLPCRNPYVSISPEYLFIYAFEYILSYTDVSVEYPGKGGGGGVTEIMAVRLILD